MEQAKFTTQPRFINNRSVIGAIVPNPSQQLRTQRWQQYVKGLDLVKEDQITVTKAANSESQSEFIKHGLESPPVVLAWGENSLDLVRNLQPMPDIRISSSGSVEGPGLVNFLAKVNVDVLNIYFSVETPDVSGSPAGPYASEVEVTFTYQILRKVVDAL